MLNMIRHHEHDVILKRDDWPKTTEKQIEVYTRTETKRFLKTCDPDERLLFELFLCTGFRDAEVSHLFWSDIDFELSRISVTAKTKPRFAPKSYEIRSVDIPNSSQEAQEA